MKHTTLKLVSVILALSVCFVLGSCTAKSSQQAANAATSAPTTNIEKTANATTAATTTNIEKTANATTAAPTTRSRKSANATTIAPKTQTTGIKFDQIFAEYYISRYIPDIENIKYKDAKKYSANVIISSYEVYASASEKIYAQAKKHLPTKDKSFFNAKSIILHFDIDTGLELYTEHIIKSISVDGKTMTIEEYRKKNTGLVPTTLSVHVVAIEVNKSDIQSVENIVVNHHDS